MRRQSIEAIAATVILMLGLASVATAADPIIGTWKLNVAKSQFATPESTPKELTEVYRKIEGDQIDFTYTVTLKEGSSHLFKAVWPAQGGTVNVLQGDDPAVSRVQTLIEPGNWYLTALHDGKQVEFIHKTFSKDRKTMLQNHKGVDRQGKPYEYATIYDKQ